MSVRLHRLVLGCFAALLSLLPARAAAPLEQPSVWKNVVIKGGGFVSGLAYHPTQRDVLYARTDVGGAFRWQPASGSWLPLNDALGKDDSQLTGVLSIGLDPHDANRVYLACGQYLPWWAQNAAILRSSDQGATWSRTDLPLKLGGNSDGRSTGERLQVDPNLGTILFLGTNQDGLWQSTDRALTWTKVNSFTPTSATLVVFDPTSATAGHATPTLYVGVNSTTAASLHRSTDGGVTWAAVPGQPTGLMPHHAKFAADGTLYLSYADNLGPNGLTRGAIWKLKPSDGSWTNITPSPTGQGGFAGLALDALHPGTLVVTTLDRWAPRDEIYRSTDSGATWKALNALSARDGSSAPYSTASTPHWIGAIELDPFNADRAFYITGYGVFSTENLTAADTNAPIIWSFRNDGLEETVPLGLVSPPTGAPLVSVIGDIDGFRHDDLTLSPPRGRHAPSVGTNNSLDFAELASAVMVRTHGGGTQRGSRSTDGGTSWTFFGSSPAPATADKPGAIAISADGARLVWAPTNAAAFYSTDNGATWTASTGGPAASSNTSYTPVADRVNPQKFYLYDPVSGLVYVSSNGGAAFSSTATVPAGADPVRAVPGHEGHLWQAAWSGGLYRSTDSAAALVKVATVQEGYRIGFGKPATGQSYPAIFLWGKVDGLVGLFRSDDTGATWVRINDTAHQFGWINALTGDPRTFGRVYLATGGRGIIYGDPGQTLTSVAWNSPAPIVAGTALSATQLNATSGGVPGTFTYTPAAGTVPAVGPLTLSVTFTPSDSVHFASSSAQVSLTVLPVDTGTSATRLTNISTRAFCGTGNSVTIGGFVISGALPKRVLVRAIGPTLVDRGIASTEVLADPTIEVHDARHDAIVALNDNWGDNSNAADLTATGQLIGAGALRADDTKSAALLVTMAPGVYSFIVKGKTGGSGIVLLEVYDADPVPTGSAFVNISARAHATTGNGVTIGGFVVSGRASKPMLLRAVGPTLVRLGLSASEVLADPRIELHGATIRTNDNWGSDDRAAILAASARVGATPLESSDTTSAALLVTLPPGVYSFIAQGNAGASGSVLVEVYDAE